jgi:hypothetical protein
VTWVGARVPGGQDLPALRLSSRGTTRTAGRCFGRFVHASGRARLPEKAHLTALPIRFDPAACQSLPLCPRGLPASVAPHAWVLNGSIRSPSPAPGRCDVIRSGVADPVVFPSPHWTPPALVDAVLMGTGPAPALPGWRNTRSVLTPENSHRGPSFTTHGDDLVDCVQEPRVPRPRPRLLRPSVEGNKNQRRPRGTFRRRKC